MLAGTAKIDITPGANVWMDGMIRSHRSVGVHDPLFARALFLSPDEGRSGAFAIVCADLCGLTDGDARAVRKAAALATGIPAEHFIVTTTHTHSGPAAVGYLNPSEPDYVREILPKLADALKRAADDARPAAAGCASGREETISHYRRLLADDGHVVMNWEPYPPEHILHPLGEIDPEVGVLRVVEAGDPARTICVLFNHAGHPNVMSGENYLISSDYPGVAARLLEEEFGGTAIFVNGAQGTMDIDGLRDRDWDGVQRCGEALAAAVAEAARETRPGRAASLRGAHIDYSLPRRRITDSESAWAQGVIEKTGGAVQSRADGVGDDFLALHYQRLRQMEGSDCPVTQVCFAEDDTAFISFPGELFTEIGMRIKAESPFGRTCILGLANGNVGYIPTREAIGQGGYEVTARALDDAAEELVVECSLALLRQVRELR